MLSTYLSKESHNFVTSYYMNKYGNKEHFGNIC